MLSSIYHKLLSRFGPQNWWPVSGNGHRGWEVCVGAVLTQNTNWNNVEKALQNLITTKQMDPKNITSLDKRRLQRLIRSSGFYKQKARRLKTFAEFVLGFGTLDDFLKRVTREQLLALNGIGPETADSILLYACERPYFVIDAYTRRIFSRLGLIETKDYEELRTFFESNLPKDVNVYKEFHALIVRLAKEHCRKKPLCETCPLTELCKHRKDLKKKNVS
jgi:endonuclease-3 related protein